MVRLLHDRAKAAPKRLVFAEADQMDVLKAAQIVHEEGIAIPILLGRQDVIEKLKAEIVTPDFKEFKNGGYKMISFFAKRARKASTKGQSWRSQG